MTNQLFWTAKELNKNIPWLKTCFLLHSSIIHVNKPTLPQIGGMNCKWYGIASVIDMVESTPHIVLSSKHQSSDLTHFWYDEMRHAGCMTFFIHFSTLCFVVIAVNTEMSNKIWTAQNVSKKKNCVLYSHLLPIKQYTFYVNLPISLLYLVRNLKLRMGNS